MDFSICEICGKAFGLRLFHTGKGGDVVRFADYVEPPHGSLGAHPHGLRWICDEHLERALGQSAKDSDSAIRELKAELGCPEDAPVSPELEEPELWVTEIGPNRARVCSLVRRARGLTPAEARTVMNAERFRIARNWPQEFAFLEQELVDAGATVEVRYSPWDDADE